jgi:hypothetical protein
VELFELEQRLLSRIMTRSRMTKRTRSDAAYAPGLAAVGEWLVEHGYWIPSRDLLLLHRTLLDHGLLGNVVRLTTPAPFETDLRRAVDRIRGLVMSSVARPTSV